MLIETSKTAIAEIPILILPTLIPNDLTVLSSSPRRLHGFESISAMIRPGTAYITSVLKSIHVFMLIFAVTRLAVAE